MKLETDSAFKIDSVVPCSDGKVCITLSMVMDAHHLVDVSGHLLSVAARRASATKKEKRDA